MAVFASHPHWPTLKWANDALSAIIVLLAVYIFLLPLVPQFGWWLRHSAPLISTPVRHGPITKTAVIPIDNRLIIPALNLDDHIYEGQSIYTVNKGVWLRPTGSAPDKGSNTVLVGHRFTYSGPQGVFYFLDKLKTGDGIIIYWHQRPYAYRVSGVHIVAPTDIAIEAPSAVQELTLYTCTPLWTSQERLVITALPVRTT